MDLENLMQDENFKEAIASATSCEEIEMLLRAKGVDVSAKEIESALNMESGEMSETELETVSGGMSISTLINGIIDVLRSLPHHPLIPHPTPLPFRPKGKSTR